MKKMKKIKEKTVYRFKKGESAHLDEIYDVQGLCGGDWWDNRTENRMDDDLIITRDIHFEIVEYEVKAPNRHKT